MRTVPAPMVRTAYPTAEKSDEACKIGVVFKECSTRCRPTKDLITRAARGNDQAERREVIFSHILSFKLPDELPGYHFSDRIARKILQLALAQSDQPCRVDAIEQQAIGHPGAQAPG